MVLCESAFSKSSQFVLVVNVRRLAVIHFLLPVVSGHDRHETFDDGFLLVCERSDTRCVVLAQTVPGVEHGVLRAGQEILLPVLPGHRHPGLGSQDVVDRAPVGHVVVGRLRVVGDLLHLELYPGLGGAAAEPDRATIDGPEENVLGGHPGVGGRQVDLVGGHNGEHDEPLGRQAALGGVGGPAESPGDVVVPRLEALHLVGGQLRGFLGHGQHGIPEQVEVLRGVGLVILDQGVVDVADLGSGLVSCGHA